MKDSGVVILLIFILLFAQQGTQGRSDKQQKTGGKGKCTDHEDGAPDFFNDGLHNGVPDGADGFQRFNYSNFNQEKSYEQRNDFGLMK